MGIEKGLWNPRGDAGRESWSLEGPAFPGHSVNHAVHIFQGLSGG